MGVALGDGPALGTVIGWGQGEIANCPHAIRPSGRISRVLGAHDKGGVQAMPACDINGGSRPHPAWWVLALYFALWSPETWSGGEVTES